MPFEVVGDRAAVAGIRRALVRPAAAVGVLRDQQDLPDGLVRHRDVGGVLRVGHDLEPALARGRPGGRPLSRSERAARLAASWPSRVPSLCRGRPVVGCAALPRQALRPLLLPLQRLDLRHVQLRRGELLALALVLGDALLPGDLDVHALLEGLDGLLRLVAPADGVVPLVLVGVELLRALRDLVGGDQDARERLLAGGELEFRILRDGPLISSDRIRPWATPAR